MMVDLERGIARLADSKTGAKNVHLNGPARAVLARLYAIRQANNPWGQRIAAAMVPTAASLDNISQLRKD